MTEEAFMEKEYQAFMDIMETLKNTRNKVQVAHEALRTSIVQYFECLPKYKRGKYKREKISVNASLQGQMYKIYAK